MTRIMRTDLQSISQFAKLHKLSRLKVYELIKADYFSIENIAGTDYINISDPAIIKNALNTVSKDKRGTWTRSYNNKPSRNRDENDIEFEREWRESMEIEDPGN